MASHYARRSGEDADDLLQEAWLVFFEALSEVDVAIGQPEQFLLQRARWGLLDAIRRSVLRRCAPLEEAPEPAASSGEVPLSDFIERLTPTQRQVALGLIDGQTFREVGDGLGCSSANIAYHAQKLREAHLRWGALEGADQRSLGDPHQARGDAGPGVSSAAHAG